MHQKGNTYSIGACPSVKNDEEEAEFAFPPFDCLTLNDHKNSIDLSQLPSCDKEVDSSCSVAAAASSFHSKEQNHNFKRGKHIQKQIKWPDEEKRSYLSKRRRIAFLEERVEQLQREVQSLRRNEHNCLNCGHRSPDYYRARITELIHTEEPSPGGPGDLARRSSEGSLQFQKIDFHMPLMQSQEMEEKMWIFLGTMLIAMGSKVMDFDGTINTFRVLKNSVDRMRRQVQKGQQWLGFNFFCSKLQMHEEGAAEVDGMGFDPFFAAKEDTRGHFSLQGVKLESVQQYELFYDYKYDFSIKYDALLTIMQYARSNCTLS